MKWTKEEEEIARNEYDRFMEALFKTEDFKNEWKGHWEDVYDTAFGRKTLLKGDKHSYMIYWLSNRDIIENKNWNKIEEGEEYGDF